MNPPPLDLATIALALKDSHVDFVVIGGAGAYAWGAPRLPEDLDVVIRCAWDNFERAATALRQLDARAYFPEFGADALEHLPRTRLTPELVQMSPISTWMTDHGELDLFDSVLARGGPARYWEEIHPGSSRRRIGAIPVDVASIDTLIASKLAFRRPKDLETVDELRRIAADRALRERVRCLASWLMGSSEAAGRTETSAPACDDQWLNSVSSSRHRRPGGCVAALRDQRRRTGRGRASSRSRV